MADRAEPPPSAEIIGDGDARAATLALLAQRQSGATVCPSEVARVLAAPDWRTAMPRVHAAIDALLAEGLVRLSWKGRALGRREGPYRIAAACTRSETVREAKRR